MDQLRNLEELYAAVTQNFTQYDGTEFILPNSFREQVKEIDNSTVVYYEHSAVINTKKGLSIFLPNQWFYIASYFTELYNELQRYKQEAIKIVSSERLKSLNGSSLSEDEKRKLQSLSMDDTSKSYLERFMTDYSWWNGAKTIDRGDFYVSPILNCAKLVNASQSYIADLCAFLADKKDLVDALIHSAEEVSTKKSDNQNLRALQQIYFGAPGTGKSHEIKSQIQKHKSFRITFHPDTDYSSFVGAYKPTSVEVPMLTTLGEKAIPVKDMEGNPLTENKIIYTYVKQAFLNAYIEAWKEHANETPQPVYLVIEEINRGNCAQIFGDIFQLLDRNTNGFSDYAIVPDADLSRHVKKDLEKLVIANRDAINAIYEECEEDMVEKVVNGKVLLLPNNLYIWATMNTSDQSLFPIDSAFKRRWDWKYIKIADAHKNWQIKVDTKTYDWWQFVQAINYFVFDATQSEDKNLGYFFAKAKDGVINAETFVSKVIFYLYTDVFKDYGFSGDIFKGANDDEMTFQSFYNADGSPCEAQIIRFIENVMFSDALPETLKVAVSTEDEDINVYDEDEAVDNRQSSNRDKFMVNGAGSYGKCLAPFEAVKAYSKQNPQMNAAEIVQVWSNLNVNHMPHLVETEQDFEERAKTTKDVKFRVKAKRLELPNGEVIYVSNQFNPIRIAELIEKLNKANLGVNISLIEH